MTKTASFDWNKINPEIKISFTKKKFFNKFYFRINYLIPGARLISYDTNDNRFDWRIQNYNSLGLSRLGWRGERGFRAPANIQQIKDFAKIYHSTDHLCPLKFRIEADQFSIYSNSENYLYKLATNELARWQTELLSVSVIECEQDRILLDQGYVIANKPQTHPYKIKIRETFNFQQERRGLEIYLQNLGNSVKVTKYMLGRLSLEHKYFPGGYIYVNDVRIIDMLRLVSPNLVGSVQQLVTQ